MEKPLDMKKEFLDKTAEDLREKFIICFNGMVKDYQKSDLLLKEEILPALLHSASFASFNFLTYLASYYAKEGYEKSFFDDYQKQFAVHCAIVLQQIEDNKGKEPEIIITPEEIINA